MYTFMFSLKINFQEAVAGSGNVMESWSQFGGVIRSLGPTGCGESPHMLHYAHELARRDVEISNLRKAKHQLEGTFRELQRAATTKEEQDQEKINELKEEVARLTEPYINKIVHMMILEPLAKKLQCNGCEYKMLYSK